MGSSGVSRLNYGLSIQSVTESCSWQQAVYYKLLPRVGLVTKKGKTLSQRHCEKWKTELWARQQQRTIKLLQEKKEGFQAGQKERCQNGNRVLPCSHWFAPVPSAASVRAGCGIPQWAGTLSTTPMPFLVSIPLSQRWPFTLMPKIFNFFSRFLDAIVIAVYFCCLYKWSNPF